MAPTAPLPLDASRYPLRDPASLPSPRLLVFRAQVERNIARMRDQLEAVVPGSGFAHLRSHVKTCKSSWAVRLQIAAGITRFKATPNELDMLLAAGARDILIAYPPLPETAERIARAIALDVAPARARGPLRLLAQAGAPEHVQALSDAAHRHQVKIPCLLDLDVGMGRTGVAPEYAPELARILAAAPGLHFAGLHAYDGHNHGATPEARSQAAAEAMDRVAACAERLRRRGLPASLIVGGGTPGFLPDLKRLLEARAAETIEVSPGTWIYWDSNYERLMPGMFEPAALVFARVMDRAGKDRFTLDLGHKRWAIDSGPLDTFSAAGLEVVATSEEHTVLRAEGAALDLRIGDHLLLVPRHVCPTVNLWEDFSVVGPDGSLEIQSSPVDARNR